MDAKFIAKIKSLRPRVESAQKRWSSLHEHLIELKQQCDHRDETGKLSVIKRMKQRICNFCGEAVFGRENLSVYNSYETPARKKRVEKLIRSLTK